MDIENLQEDQEQDQMADLLTGGEAAADGGAEGGDWRIRMQQESREITVNMIMEKLKRYTISFHGEDGMEKLKEAATEIEEEIYVAATSESDYLRKIYLKMETKIRNSMVNSLRSNAASNSKPPQVPGSQSLETEVQDRVQKCQSQLKQQLLSQNIQNNIPFTVVPNIFGSSSALPSFGGNSQATVPSVLFQTPQMPSLFNATPNAAGNLIGQGSPASLMSQVAQRQKMRQQLLARSRLPQLQPLGNTSIRNTQQGIQSTDLTPQQQTTIDQQNMLQNLQLQSGIANLRLPPLSFQSMLTQMPQTLSQNIPSTGVPNSSGLTTALPRVGGKSQGTVPNVSVQNPNMQNMYHATPYAMRNSVGQASIDSSSQTESETNEDWQEETYQKIKAMHEMYYPELNELYQKVVDQVQQHDALPQQPKNEQLEKLRSRKLAIERLIKFLQTNKNDILPIHEGKIAGVEKHIKRILIKGNWSKVAPPSSLPGQSTQPPMHAMLQLQMSQTHTNEGQMNSQMQPVNTYRSSLLTQQNTLTGLQNAMTSAMNSLGSPQNNVAMKQNLLAGPQPMTASADTSTNGLSNSNMLQPNSSILNPQYQQLQFQQLRLHQEMEAQQLFQQQQFTQRLMLQLHQQQISQLQKATKLHMQPMQLLQQKQPQLQPLQPHLMQPGLSLQKQQHFQQLTRQPLVVQPPQQKILNQEHLKQKLPLQTSQDQPEHTPEKLWDVEKQPLIPKPKTSQKQRSGQKTLPRLKTASLILVLSAVLLLVLVMMLLGVVLGTNQLYWG